MLFLTAISLYTVRVTLNALGDMDYGIYNVVASVVASLSFLTGTLTSATQRFLSFHLGKNDYKAYSRTFSLLLMGFAVISIAIVVIGEAVGVFFLNDWLVIPPDRLRAAKLVYQASIFTFIFHLLAVPYTSSIVANERMNAFAYISIIDGILKLLLVYMLLVSPFDRLVYYGFLTLAESFVVLALYAAYCHRAFRYCKFEFLWDKALFRELTSYTGWNLFGSVSAMLVTQGQNILLNMFFGPLVNTAKGIADRVNGAVSTFATNFYMAVTPQIIKSYAAGETERMRILVMTSSRFTFFLLLAISFPLITIMEDVLNMWLGSGSASSTMVTFSQLSLVFCLVNSLEQPITQMIRATGNIRSYQFRVGVMTLMYIPIAALVLWLGASPVSTMIVLVALYAVVQIVRVVLAHMQVDLQYGQYVRNVAVPIVIVSAVAAALYPLLCRMHWHTGYGDVLAKALLSEVLILCAIAILGLKQSDRRFLAKTIAKVLHRNV